VAEKKRRKRLSEEELEAERGDELPDREALTVLDGNVAIPVDPSIAADVLAGEDPPEADRPEDAGAEPEPRPEPPDEG
jgi:hypothetical protein